MALGKDAATVAHRLIAGEYTISKSHIKRAIVEMQSSSVDTGTIAIEKSMADHQPCRHRADPTPDPSLRLPTIAQRVIRGWLPA